LAFAAAGSAAAVTPPAGYIYSTQLLGSLTQGCIASGPGGTFVGIGPGFTANAQSVVLAKESGDLRLVAAGFNSISDCAYDQNADILYVTDNANNADLGITSPFGAQTGDTVFAIPNASTASGLTAPGLELLPPDSIPLAASVAVDSSGNVFVADSAGPPGLGSVLKISGGVPVPFITGQDYSAGLAFNPANGNLFAAETLGSFQAQIRQFTPAGTPVPPDPFAGPSFSFGSYDMAFNLAGRLLVTGAFLGDVLAFNPSDSSSTTFASGLTYATGITVHPHTKRVEILSTTFANLPEDKSLHRFTPISLLAPGKGMANSECLHEAYGLQIVNGKAECTDGDPCDADGKENNACLFPIGFCFNVSDPNFPTCSTGSNITAVAVTATPPSAAVANAASRVGVALPLSGSTCVFSDGHYVPLKIKKNGSKANGKATVRVVTSAADNRKDTDTYTLVCKPAP
jgi:hypothetical protein